MSNTMTTLGEYEHTIDTSSTRSSNSNGIEHQTGKNERGNQFTVLRETDSKKTGCEWKTVVKWIAVAAAVLGLVAGTFSLLITLGIFQFGVNGVAMSAATGLYVTIGGYGAAGILGMLLGVSCYLDRSKKRVEVDDIEPPEQSCLTNFCTKKKTQNPNAIHLGD